MFFDHYPYTNFHNVNLDWVLQAVKSWGELVDTNNLAFKDLKEANESFKEYVTNYLHVILPVEMEEQITESVSKWLDEHPEATTTVLDGSLTVQKFSQELKLKTIKDYVTPQMFGAKGDGINDDTDSFRNALQASDIVFVPIGTYLLTSPLSLSYQKRLIGANRYTTILKFAENVNGIQFNRSTCIRGITINVTGNVDALFMITSANHSYNLSSVFEDLTIENNADVVSGNAIKITAINTGLQGQPEGCYNATFRDIRIWGKWTRGISLENRVATTTATETWITGLNFVDIFIQSAETAIESSWIDISSNNAVPITSAASKNGDIKFVRVNAQYTEGVTRCYARIYNITNVVFDSCTPFDFWHLRYSYHLPIFEFNGYSGMCSAIILGSSEIPSLTIDEVKNYIGFINIDGANYLNVYEKVIALSLTQGGAYPTIRGHVEPSLLNGTEYFTPATENIENVTYSLYKRGGVAQFNFAFTIDVPEGSQGDYVTIGRLGSLWRPLSNVMHPVYEEHYTYLLIGADGYVKIRVTASGRVRLWFSECFVLKEV